jgi:hypothetical protein
MGYRRLAHAQTMAPVSQRLRRLVLYRANYHISVGMWCDGLWKTHQKRFWGQPSREKQRMFLFARSIDFYRANLAKQRNAFACQSDAAIVAVILDCHNRNAMREPT